MFEGKKVRLRSFELSDLDNIMINWNKINLRRELGPVVPHSRKEREDWIRRTWEDRRIGRSFAFAMDNIKSGEFLGHCTLANVRPINRTASVSIAIYKEENRGKGYGTDAMRVLLEFGFDYLNLRHFYSHLHQYPLHQSNRGRGYSRSGRK